MLRGFHVCRAGLGLSVAGRPLEGLELPEHPHWSPAGPEATSSWEGQRPLTAGSHHTTGHGHPSARILAGIIQARWAQLSWAGIGRPVWGRGRVLPRAQTCPEEGEGFVWRNRCRWGPSVLQDPTLPRRRIVAARSPSPSGWHILRLDTRKGPQPPIFLPARRDAKLQPLDYWSLGLGSRFCLCYTAAMAFEGSSSSLSLTLQSSEMEQ